MVYSRSNSMVPNDSAAGILPQEILIEILSAFRSSRSALKACSLINKTWLHACRVILFHSIDLTALLAKKDWLTVFVNMPLKIGDHVREITIQNARLASESGPMRVLILFHFAASVTSLRLSNITISDFAHVTTVVSILKELQSLSIQNVQFDSNRLDFSEPVAPNKSFPHSLKSLYLYHVDLGLFFDWIHAHPIVPRLSKAYFGPLESCWKLRVVQYFLYALPDNLSEIGFLFPDSPTALYSQYGTTGGPMGSHVLSPSAHLQSIMNRHQARYGVPLNLNPLAFTGNLRNIRVHKFIPGEDRESNVCAIWSARLMINIKKGFRGRIVLDVEAKSVRAVDVLEIDWEFLEDVFSDEVYDEVEAIVFLVLTDINISKLENLISLKMPNSYARGILRFEGANETTFRPPTKVL